MSDLSDDLDATADSVISDARRLIAIEEEKRSRGPRDARQPQLGREAQAVSDGLARKVAAQSDLVARMGRRRDS